jgi:hypothetical protein
MSEFYEGEYQAPQFKILNEVIVDDEIVATIEIDGEKHTISADMDTILHGLVILEEGPELV